MSARPAFSGRSTRRDRALLEDIEQRILYSADHPLAAAFSASVGASLTDTTLQQPASAIAHEAQKAMLHEGGEIVFIDARVPDADALAQDIAAQADAGRNISVVRIGADEDGIVAINRALADTQGVTAVHVISHGSDGALLLGTTTLDRDTLLLRAPEIAEWAGHLSSDADLLLYGCDVAEGSDGLALVQGLAQLTGADVAASIDKTGAAALGGNWGLEVRTGAIEAAGALDARGQALINGLLATFTVTTTADSGAGSLRTAITSANGAAGTDTINFAIGSGVKTITILSALPTITGVTTINGASQPGFAANGSKPVIVLDGNNGNYDGLELASGSGGSTINGLVIRNFGQEGIQIDSGSDGNTITGNYIGQLGTDGLAGPAGSGNRTGIQVSSIGNLIGGNAVAARNVISGNDGAGASDGMGIAVLTGSGVGIYGNYIGTDATGNTALGNVHAGLYLAGGQSSSDAGWGNVIAGNGQYNIWNPSGTLGYIRFKDNSIGVSADGTKAFTPLFDSILIQGNISFLDINSNVIAGGSRNAISLDGAFLNSTALEIRSNTIGTDASTGTSNWGAGQDGVFLGNGTNYAAGKSLTIHHNLIANSGQSGAGYAGVRIDSTVTTGATPLQRNNIRDSSGLGIDLGAVGVQANDVGDADSGPNDLQNYPVITSVEKVGSNLNIAFTLTADVVDPDMLIDRADQALYFSKKNGRNRATVWTASLAVSAQAAA